MGELLNTISLNNVYDSLSSILGVSKESIRYYIVKNKFDLVDSDINDVDLQKFFIFLKRDNNQEKITPMMDSITISHLTTRISDLEEDNATIYNLFGSLLQDTDLSLFFKEYGITFKEKNGKIEVTNDGKIIDWEKYHDKAPVAGMVKKRLEGYSITGVDKSINGFLFNGEIYKNRNVNHILRYPEILENILRVMKKDFAVYEWMKRATPYIITFKVNINDLVFDSCDKLNNKQKVYRIIKHCLIFLSKKLLTEWSENENPIIRLKDNLHVKSHDILKIRKVEK
ncbi:hypothetical protein [Heyndrickxia ginsengihumi]|uniref:hypothetical protein n=1 Tax=Heyndrickxia ginsengihumi TaxID=363870 RepID=UPI00046ECA36|nr:hypothetical protein [Heyndrickxia ginsengihumi]